MAKEKVFVLTGKDGFGKDILKVFKTREALAKCVATMEGFEGDDFTEDEDCQWVVARMMKCRQWHCDTSDSTYKVSCKTVC